MSWRNHSPAPTITFVNFVNRCKLLNGNALQELWGTNDTEIIDTFVRWTATNLVDVGLQADADALDYLVQNVSWAWSDSLINDIFQVPA